MPSLSGVQVSSPIFCGNSETWIDKRGLPKRIPMRLLCLGLGRTGTTSLRVALHELGYSTYHGWSLMENPPDCVLWKEALTAKYEGEGKLYGREEFDSMFCDSDAVLDIPGSLFTEELIRAYPDAKVIVTTRDLDSWYRSWMATIVPAQKGDIFARLLVKLDKAVGMYIPLMKDCVKYKYRGAFLQPGSGAAEAVYTKHVETIRNLVRENENYLEFDVKQGYGPLCKFLGKDIPRDEQGNVKAFPRVNDAGDFQTIFGDMFKAILLKRVTEWAIRALGLAVLGWSAWWASRRLREQSIATPSKRD